MAESRFAPAVLENEVVPLVRQVLQITDQLPGLFQSVSQLLKPLGLPFGPHALPRCPPTRSKFQRGPAIVPPQTWECLQLPSRRAHYVFQKNSTEGSPLYFVWRCFDVRYGSPYPVRACYLPPSFWLELRCTLLAYVALAPTHLVPPLSLLFYASFFFCVFFCSFLLVLPGMDPQT